MSNRAVKIENFGKGIINRIEAKSIPRGAASASNGFITKLDSIQLVRGRLLLGTNIAGIGKVVGLEVAQNFDGSEVLYKRQGTNLAYYDTVTEDFINAKTNLTDGEEVTFANYQSLAGAQFWMGSITDGLFKIMVANPASVVDLNASGQNHKGFINAKDNRIYLWNRKEDKTALYLSYIDAQNYTTVAGENIGTGDGSEKTFSDTLAKGSDSKHTVFAVTVTDSVETFTDNFDGTLTGDAGGTGTINYATGAISVTFNSAPAGAQAITSDYEFEDSSDQGIADFTESATRLAGEGAVFRQDQGGDPIRNVVTYGDDRYSFKERRIFKLTLTADDTNATNNVYRERAGLPAIGMTAETEEGIYFMDNSTKNEPKLRLMQTSISNDVVQPRSVSDVIDLTGFEFDVGDMITWGDYIVFSGRTDDATLANVTFIYDRFQKTFDILPWPINKFAVYNGALVGGESISHNVYELFSGTDDDESGYDASWEGHEDTLGVERLKKLKRFRVQGKIGVDQKIYVDLKFDDDNYQNIGVIEGTADYVDAGQSVAVGAVVVGKNEVGGGGDGIEAFNYKTEFVVNSDKFFKVIPRFRIDGDLGWAEVSMFEFFDIRLYKNRLPSKYRS